MLSLSQGQLNTLTTCPRKFQHLYLDQLSSPASFEQQERLAWGSQFHLLMQQRELGLAIDPPVELFNPIEQQLQHCVNTFVQAAPHLFATSAHTVRQSEHRLTLEFEGYLLTVVYDLLILDEQQAQILDWKTYPRPQTGHWLAQNWQTRLYPFVLAETADYTPEQISMTYWFVQAIASASSPTSEPEQLTFAYSTAQHQQTRQELSQLLHQLTDWLQHYETGAALPQISLNSRDCQTCTFAPRCQRQDIAHPIPTLAEIEEVVL